MSYKIAVATSDGQAVDLSFGECEKFQIYEVNAQGDCTAVETRICQNDLKGAGGRTDRKTAAGCGCQGGGNACTTMHGAKVERLSDCRCILCIRAGEKVKKLFDAKAVTLFEIKGDIPALMKKIIIYYARINGRRDNL